MVPVNKELLTGTVPVNKKLLTGTVSVNKELLTGTVPVNNLFLIGYIFCIRGCIYEIHILIEISKNRLGEQKKVSSKTNFNQREYV